MNHSQLIWELVGEFRTYLKMGRNVSISDYVQRVNVESREELLRELIKVELDYKSRNKLEISSDDFQHLGPTASDVVKNWIDDEPTATIAHQDTVTEGSRSERFEVLRPFAEGGLGKVSIAIDHELNREVALKEVKQGLEKNSEALIRFSVEAEVTGNLEHPGIVPIYGLGFRENGTPYYAMRFIRGESLGEACKQYHSSKSARSDSENAMEFRGLLKRFVEVCNAIEYAHSRGIIHRDIKPSNIMLGKFGETLVVDWGLAKSQGRDELHKNSGEATLLPKEGAEVETLMGSAVGTPAFMSPEQGKGDLDQIGPKSDIFGLGATLFFLLTNRPPYASQDLRDLLRDVIAVRHPSPREIDSSIPRPLEAVCLNAMALEKDDRYSRAIDLANDIERWLADEPVSAFREGPTAKYFRWNRKHPRISLSIFLTVVFGAVLSLVSYRLATFKTAEIKMARDSAEENATLLEAALQELQKKEAAAVSTIHFLKNDLLAYASPDIEPDRNITLKEVLDKVAPTVTERFKSNPVVGASVSQMLGNTYRQLGEYNAALPLLDSAHKTLISNLGENDRRTIGCANELTQLYLRNGEFEKAARLANQYFLICKDRLEANDRYSMDCTHNLASVYKVQGRYRESLKLNELNLARRTEAFTESDRDTLTSMGSVSLNLRSLGKFKEAELMHRKVLRLRQEHLGEQHPETLGSTINLARLLIEVEKYDEAESLIDQSYSLAQKVLTADHPYSLMCLEVRAELLSAKGMMDDAMRLLENVAEKRKGTDDVNSQRLNGCQLRIARIYRRQRMFQQAETLLNKILANYDSYELGYVYRTEFRAMRELATLYRQTKRYDESFEVLNDLAARQKKFLGNESPENNQNLYQLALTHQQQGNLKKSQELLEKAFEGQKEILGTDHPLTLSIQQSIGWTEYKLGNHIDCKNHLEFIVSKKQAIYGTHHSAYHKSIADVAQFHILTGQPDLASEWYLKLLVHQRRHLPQEHPELHNTMTRLATVFEDNKQAGRAEPLRREIAAQLEKSRDSQTKKIDAELHLANNLLLQERHEDCSNLLATLIQDKWQFISRHRDLQTMLFRLAVFFETNNEPGKAELYRKTILVLLGDQAATWDKKSDAMLLMANNLMLQEKHDQCIEFCDSSLEQLEQAGIRSPNCGLIRFCRGISMIASNQAVEGNRLAESSYRELLSVGQFSNLQKNLLVTYTRNVVDRFIVLNDNTLADSWRAKVDTITKKLSADQ